MENQYEKMSLAELRAAAKEKGMQGISAKKKQELLELLLASEGSRMGEAAAQRESAVVREEPTRENPVRENSQENTAGTDGKKAASGERTKRSFEARRPRADEAQSRDVGNARNSAPAQRSGGYGRENRGGGQEYRDNTRDNTRENANFRDNARENANFRENTRNGRDTARDGRSRMNGGHANPYTNQNPHQGQNVQQNTMSAQSAQNTQNLQSPQNMNPQSLQGNIQSMAEQRENVSMQSGQNAAGGNANGGAPQSSYRPPQQLSREEIEQLDSGETKEGILEIMQEGFGFIRCDNFLPGSNDVYVSPLQIRRMNLKTGDIIVGNTKIRSQTEKFSALLYVKSINGLPPAEALKRPRFEDLTPIFPNRRIHLETPGCKPSMRMVDLVSPIGKGQRGMIVAQPKAGKTTLLKQIARAVNTNHPEMHMIILLIDERPEEVTDMKESIQGDNVEVIYSTFDELPENHKRVSEMVIERAKRLVEHGRDVIILLDSITRLARAYNLTVQSSGRTLSGGLDPAALHMPKKIFGAARNMREGGSLTILATALVETGSRMDDVVFEEFKGTGNMELVLDRNLSERRVFPAIDLPRSSTRRDDLLLAPGEMEANILMRRAFNGMKSEEAVERIIQIFASTKNNNEFIETIKKTKIAY
ncbi:MAG: transcription termination factor Rho [Lachnospiraceae bacterium]|nr:transcription termination factor Rho [Lachnospiraceae bacterium]